MHSVPIRHSVNSLPQLPRILSLVAILVVFTRPRPLQAIVIPIDESPLDWKWDSITLTPQATFQRKPRQIFRGSVVMSSPSHFSINGVHPKIYCAGAQDRDTKDGSDHLNRWRLEI